VRSDLRGRNAIGEDHAVYIGIPASSVEEKAAVLEKAGLQRAITQESKALLDEWFRR